METSSFINSPFFSWVVLPFLIFLARVCDVSLGTVRILLIHKGHKILVPLLGFVEVLIWLLAVRQVVQNITNVACFFAFAGGFAMGNFVGLYLEEKLAVGIQVVRIITNKEATALIEYLKSHGFGVTHVDARGSTGPVSIIFTFIKRTDFRLIEEAILKFNPKAFYSIEDVRAVSEGVFPAKQSFPGSALIASIFSQRKGK